MKTLAHATFWDTIWSKTNKTCCCHCRLKIYSVWTLATKSLLTKNPLCRCRRSVWTNLKGPFVLGENNTNFLCHQQNFWNGLYGYQCGLYGYSVVAKCKRTLKEVYNDSGRGLRNMDEEYTATKSHRIYSASNSWDGKVLVLCLGCHFVTRRNWFGANSDILINKCPDAVKDSFSRWRHRSWR